MKRAGNRIGWSQLVVVGPVLFSTANPVTDAKVERGRLLYFDPRISKSQQISCNSGHNLYTFGVDEEATSPGHKGQRGVLEHADRQESDAAYVAQPRPLSSGPNTPKPDPG